jgi:hypothetical protein
MLNVAGDTPASTDAENLGRLCQGPFRVGVSQYFSNATGAASCKLAAARKRFPIQRCKRESTHVSGSTYERYAIQVSRAFRAIEFFANPLWRCPSCSLGFKLFFHGSCSLR